MKDFGESLKNTQLDLNLKFCLTPKIPSNKRDPIFGRLLLSLVRKLAFWLGDNSVGGGAIFIAYMTNAEPSRDELS